MRTLLRLCWFLLFTFVFSFSAFADPPHRILKLKDLRPGTRAVGFSVFKGVEPQRFDVLLGEPIDDMGNSLILVRISGDPMETPLEKVGAIKGMSGSPIFIGCTDLNDCIKNGTLVGALSYAIGYFIEGGPNALVTPAEYMLGARTVGYGIASGFSSSIPDKINIGGKIFTNLMLFPKTGDLPVASDPAGHCDSSVVSDIKPGSMITVYLATGTVNVGVSGTVTWRDGDKIYVFGHPFIGSGTVDYPFAQISVADTVQTPLGALKIPGCRLDAEGSMLIDGAFEMAGVIGKEADMVPYNIEAHMGNLRGIMHEEVANSPMVPNIVTVMPTQWFGQWLGNMSQLSLAYQFRIILSGQPEIFAKGMVPAQVYNSKTYDSPLSEALSRVYAPIKQLKESGFDHNVESVNVRLDFLDKFNLWSKKRVFLSKTTASPGETVYANVVLEEYFTGAVKQMSIPIKIPNDFMGRVGQGDAPNITVLIQSGNKFTDKREAVDADSVDDFISQLNNNLNRKDNVLYVQEVMPRTKTELEENKADARASVKQSWKWTELQEGDLRQLPSAGKDDTTLTLAPALSGFIDLDSTLTITVQPEKTTVAAAKSAPKPKHRKWFLLFLR